MPSPFPGMDPYLEGSWSDVHSRLATQISDQLASLIKPGYVARLSTRTVTGYLDPSEITQFYPAVDTGHFPQPASSLGLALAPVIDPPGLVMSLPISTEVPVTTVEIRDALGNRLVTSIELLSPVNKREPGLSEYRRKRNTVIDGGVHLLEIDLFRRGERPVAAPLPDAPYFVFLTRARQPRMEIWPIQFKQALPTVSLPLKGADADVPLDLGAAFRAIYDRARYQLTIDYQREPIPPLSATDTAWADQLLHSQGRR